MNNNIFPKYADSRLSSARLTIDLEAVVQNYKSLQSIAPKTVLAPAVKANAYGLGIAPIINALNLEGAEQFFVSHLEEAFEVRRQLPKAQIFVLNNLMKSALASYAEANLVPILSSKKDIMLWSDFWKSRSSRRPCALHIDTGINRLGLNFSDFENLVNDSALSQSITPIMIMSHLACADEPNNPLNEIQLQRFSSLLSHFPLADKSLANSAGIFLDKAYHYDIARPGIALYGGNQCCNANGAMEQTVQLDARVLQLRHINKGETIGYGATFCAEKPMRIAILGTGYGDGFPRATSGSGVALRKTVAAGGYGALWGKKLPIIGRNSMDLLAVDVTALDFSQLEQAYMKDDLWVELLGKNVPLDEVALASGTIGYEILTQLGARYSRYYKKSKKQLAEG